MSVRYQGGLLITPTGIPYEKLDRVAHCSLLMQTVKHEQASRLPASGAFIRRHTDAPDANAVAHNHAVHCTAVSILNRPIPAIHLIRIAAAVRKSHSPRAHATSLGTR
ncbi:class II aldolase/adducin family protein [Salmonella enterica subsp. enterica]|nr:class II aldolase/adducin family protein [Salmonella enterica subsp. enterica]